MSKPDKKAANQKPGKIVLLPVEQIGAIAVPGAHRL